MQTHHHHDHSALMPSDRHMGRALVIGIVLNAGFVLAEFTAGIVYDSMGLLADAGHNLSDVGGLLLSLIAFLLAQRQRTKYYSYGFRKATVLAALINATILFVAVAVIIFECLERIRQPVAIGGWPLIITAGIGIVVNGLTVLLFHRGKDRDLNIKSAYLHMLADTLVSVGVVLSGGLILWTGLTIIDPVVGLLVATVILFSAVRLMRESFRLAMDGVPTGLDAELIRVQMQSIENVKAVHHIHIWPISTTENALTAHVVLQAISAMEVTKLALRQELRQRGIAHTTLEFEEESTTCTDVAI